LRSKDEPLLTHSSKTLSPGTRIRVLVVDDSVSVRSIVTRVLSQDPTVEVVGTAANGAIGLAKIPQVNPHVITLDIEMPEMNGLEMLKRVRLEHPDVVVIMISTLTAPGATATLDALMLGANDYVTKPSHSGSLEGSIDALRAELLPKIKQFFTIIEPGGSKRTPATKSAVIARSIPCRREVLAIGVSTGGPNALAAIVPMFPSAFMYPVLIVQHMPPLFTRLLASRLQTLTRLKVEEATQGCTVEPGKILIAPGGFHMQVRKAIQDNIIMLDQSSPRNSCRPSVDVLFESVNEVYGQACIAAVLTGMGQDGLRGAEVLKSSGAHIIVQDEASSVVWGMPGFIAKAGLADAVVPLESIVPEVLNQFEQGSRAAARGAK
jgi:two-component system chemotaxis response regulator CheB